MELTRKAEPSTHLYVGICLESFVPTLTAVDNHTDNATV
jgi:hypothetical protein